MNRKVLNESNIPKTIKEENNSINPSITIRKLMAVREMFNLKAPKRENKQSLAKLIIEALKLIK